MGQNNSKIDIVDSCQTENNVLLDREVTHLLWTGGWDSTFRLLQHILIDESVVQPHYIIRPQECTGKEIDTIHNIKREILAKFPEAGKFLKPIKFVGNDSIKPNQAITKQYEKIAESKFISLQYEIFARYCDQIGISTMELSVLSFDRFNYYASNSNLFEYFEFPLIGMSKLEMAEIADQNGWTDIMKMTWFCRRPKNGHACGFCGPCTDVVIAGMGWRLPWKARIIANLQLPFRKWWRKNYQKQSKGILKIVPKFFKGKF